MTSCTNEKAGRKSNVKDVLTHLKGISLKLLWLCEWTTFVGSLLTPQTANSWAEPDKLLSLPRRLVSDELLDVPGIYVKRGEKKNENSNAMTQLMA